MQQYDDDSPRLSKEHHERVARFLSERSALGACDICGSEQIQVSNYIVKTPVVFPQKPRRNSGYRAALYSTVCFNCCHTRFYSAQLMDEMFEQEESNPRH